MNTTMTTKTEATQRPWQVIDMQGRANFSIKAGQETIATVYKHIGSPVTMERDGQGQANAVLICKAVNSHDELVGALTSLLTYCEARQVKFEAGWGVAALHSARAALQMVKGGE